MLIGFYICFCSELGELKKSSRNQRYQSADLQLGSETNSASWGWCTWPLVVRLQCLFKLRLLPIMLLSNPQIEEQLAILSSLKGEEFKP